MTHYSFENLKAPHPGFHARNEQFAYVDGYILALEDLLKDLKDLQAKEAGGSDSHLGRSAETLLLEQRVARNAAYGSVRAIVNRSLANARDTMAMLKASRSDGDQPATPMQPIQFDPARGGVQYPTDRKAQERP